MQRKKPIQVDAAGRKRILDGWRDSNMTMQSYAESVGVSLSTLPRWKREARGTAVESPQFLELQLPGRTDNRDRERWLEVRIADGCMARMGPVDGDAVDVFCGVVARLREMPC